jgi:hypothetical protein
MHPIMTRIMATTTKFVRKLIVILINNKKYALAGTTQVTFEV